MQQIINFLIRNKNNILFLLLLAFSLFLTIQTHSFQKSKFISSANFFTGGVYSWTSDMESYFHLERNNQRLLEENRILRTRLANYGQQPDSLEVIDSLYPEKDYEFQTAEVINNNHGKINNYLTIDRGKEDGLTRDMGVVTSEGLVGIVENLSENYATVISILNSQSRINVQLSKSDHFGTLVWNGNDPNVVQLTDVPGLAPVAKGDTVITGGRSHIFPKGIPVGEIEDYTLDQSQSYYTIDIRLFNDMTNIGFVYLIANKNKEEVIQLENISNQ